MKWRVRVVPSIVRYAKRKGRAPAGLALGFAAYLRLVRDRTDLLADGQADRITSHWQETGDDLSAFVRAVCADTSLWGTDLNRVPGFAEEVEEALRRVVRGPVEDVLAAWVGA